ncbi:coiled coils domain protein [Faustovirus]|nr:hypothetical protein F-LCD7_0435 [Faustovirus]QJX72203.1 coiled coils domain protein [Faustovirus]QJX72698.1 coiled coils domain protein [Faustovirus]SMH63212.1 Hypothetical protein FSTVLC9_6 [Faustovirus]
MANSDIEIQIMEERLKIARIRNENLKDHLDSLDAVNARMEQTIQYYQNAMFWDDIYTDLLTIMRTNLTASTTDIVASAYTNCNYIELEQIGLVQNEYSIISD